MVIPLTHKSRWYNLFGEEAMSDVTLEVGKDGTLEQIPAHSWVLAAESQYFRDMFQGHLSHPDRRTYPISSDPTTFRALLMWMYRGECQVEGWREVVSTLHVALQYRCVDLAGFCLQICGEYLDHHCVLHIMNVLWLHCLSTIPHSNNVVSSHPSMYPSLNYWQDLALNNSTYSDSHNQAYTHLDQLQLDSMQGSAGSTWHLGEETGMQGVAEQCREMYDRCLEVVDENAFSVLVPALTDQLPWEVLEHIVSRSTLQVPDEMLVLKVVESWSLAECERRQLSSAQDNRREVLDGLLYHVRFLHINPATLRKASSLLIEEEYNYLREQLSGSKQGGPPPPYTLFPHLSLMASPRHYTSLPEVSKYQGNKNKSFRILKRIGGYLLTGVVLVFD